MSDWARGGRTRKTLDPRGKEARQVWQAPLAIVQASSTSKCPGLEGQSRPIGPLSVHSTGPPLWVPRQNTGSSHHREGWSRPKRGQARAEALFAEARCPVKAYGAERRPVACLKACRDVRHDAGATAHRRRRKTKLKADLCMAPQGGEGATRKTLTSQGAIVHGACWNIPSVPGNEGRPL